VAAYVALADSSPASVEAFMAGREDALRALGPLAPKTVLAAGELLMLPNAKPDRLGMTVQLDARHQGK
jgi:O-succinylbenzoic acid--CoA ligase